jgi:DNA primase
MSRIPEEVIEQVRDATDIIALVGESVELKRTGSDYRGPCPFHGGTHRNFAVIPRKGLFYCYVCHEGGDAFSFLMKRFGMDYPTAVRELARRAGIVIPEAQEKQGPDPNEPLYGAVAAAGEWFARRLRESPDADEARRYLQSRDIPEDKSGELGLGYAPHGAHFMDAMRALGITDEVLLAAGLAFRRDDSRIVPRFRNRLLFPIHDGRGRPVGFGGRLLGPGEPKYLNSPETPIFHKGRQLYNLHNAKSSIRQEQVVLVVEGYFDVLRLVLAGIDHVVAPLGTALTPDQAGLLQKLAPSAVLLYDSDAAGLRATFRAGDELLRRGVRVRVATMPSGEDPDTLVRKGGAAALERVLKDAVDILERKIQLLERRGWFEGIEHRREALDRLLPTLRSTSDPIMRELYLGLVAERTGVSREVLEKEAKALPAAAPESVGPAPVRQDGRSPEPTPVRRTPVGTSAERALVTLFLADSDWLERARREVPISWFERPALREIYAALLDGVEPAALGEHLSEVGIAAWQKLLAGAAESRVDPDRTFIDATQKLEARPLFREYSALIAQREQEPDPARKAELVHQALELRTDLQRRFPEQWKQLAYTRPGDARSRQRRPHAS